jgi:hypothetical protein
MIGQGNLYGDARDFTLTAFNYCRFKIENNLLGIPMDMISGGLGCSANKMRIYAAVNGKEDITDADFGSFKEAFEESARLRDSVLEKATNVEIPDDSRIRDWLDGKLDDDENSQKIKKLKSR